MYQLLDSSHASPQERPWDRPQRLLGLAVLANDWLQTLPVWLHLDVGVANELIGSSCSDSEAADLNQRLTGWCPAEPLLGLEMGADFLVTALV